MDTTPKNGKIIVESQIGWHRAQLLDGPDGVLIELWSRKAGGVWQLIETSTLDCPLHVALNLVHDKVCGLERELVR